MCTCVFVFLCTDWCFECVECVSVSVCVCVLIYFQWEINPKKDISPMCSYRYVSVCQCV